MDDLRSHGLEDGLGFLDCQGIAADKRLQRSKLRTLLHAANRRVDQVDSSRSELLMHLLHRRGVDSAHADHDIAGCASSIKPPAPTVTSSDCAVVSTIETTLRARGDIGGAGRDLCTKCGNALIFLAIDIIRHERVPGLQNVRGHRAAHHSEADKSDGIFSGVAAQGTLPHGASSGPYCRGAASSPRFGLPLHPNRGFRRRLLAPKCMHLLAAFMNNLAP